MKLFLSLCENELNLIAIYFCHRTPFSIKKIMTVFLTLLMSQSALKHLIIESLTLFLLAT